MILAAFALHLALNPAVDARHPELTVCRPGWSAEQRRSVPSSYFARVKREMLHGRPARDFTLDHVTPIDLGGAVADPLNLQLQPKADAKAKDREEARLHRLACRGTMSLSAAQVAIASWGRR